METSDVANTPAGETTPLLPTPESARPKPVRTVTFSANPVSRTIEPEPHRLPRSYGSHNVNHQASSSGAVGPPMLAALNSKLRRRSSQGFVPVMASTQGLPKIGPQRSTKKTEKLKLLPNPDLGDEGEDEESGRDVYSQYTRIKDPTARRDAARLGKADRDRLPRVTAYCTANRYEMEGLMRFLKGRGKTRGANPKLIDECIYTPYMYGKGHRSHDMSEQQNYERRHSTGSELVDGEAERQEFAPLRRDNHDSGYREGLMIDERRRESAAELPSEELLGPAMPEDMSIKDTVLDFDIQVHTPEVFLFDYGVVVIWGMTESQEAKLLKDIAKFELEKLAPDDVETEHFNFYYTREYQARIYNDFITLRDKNNYMTKLAISHALAQSVKVN